VQCIGTWLSTLIKISARYCSAVDDGLGGGHVDDGRVGADAELDSELAA
jgi:hypothetical protein